MNLYVISPIDLFEGCITLKDYLLQEDKSIAANRYSEIALSDLAIGMSRAKTKGHWEGDIRGSIYVFALPCEVSCEVGFIWKQDNNGTTFVLSPIELDWLKGDKVD